MQERSGGGTALITGASSGIGLEIAKVFARQGHDLVLVARRGDLLDSLAKEIEGRHGVRVRTIALDLTAPGAPAALHRELKESGVEVEYLVNNAGFGLHGNFVETSLDKEVEMIGLNVLALTQLAKLFARDMAGRRRGGILNVASTAGFVPGPLMAVYYATKAYVISFSEALTNELRPKGVVVTCLCPGPTHTAFQSAAGIDSTRLFRKGVMEAPEVAEAGYRGLIRGRRLVLPGARNKFMITLSRLLPRGAILRFVRRINDRA